KVLAVASNDRAGRISIRAGDTGREMHSMESSATIAHLALASEGSRVAVAYFEGDESSSSQSPRQLAVKIWNTATGEVVRTLPMLPWARNSGVYPMILLSPDGSQLLRHSVTREEGESRPSFQQSIRIVDVASGTEVWKQEFSGLT